MDYSCGVEEKIETNISPQQIWLAWVKAHAAHGASFLAQGSRGKISGGGKKSFSYQIIDVIPGRSFSILWKTLFVRLIFHHTVVPTKKGSEVRYGFCIKGPFAWPLRYLLGNKIRANLAQVLKAFVQKVSTHESS